MFLRTALFGMVFALIAPQSRSFLGSLIASAGEEIHAKAPMSYALVFVVALAGAASILLLQSSHRRPKDPTANYRKEVRFED